MNYRFTLLLGVLLLATLTSLSVDNPPTMNGNNASPTYSTGNYDPVVVFPDFEISDSDGDNIKGITIVFTGGHHSDQDNLWFTDQNGITGSFDKSNGILVLSGDASPATYQAAVRSITYTNNAEFSSVNNEQRTLTISLANADYLDFNGHFYEHVTGSYSWAAAKTAAAAKTYYGLQGYLCTVTSEEENSHILKIEDDPNGTLWLGASDNDTPNTWKWLSGPENGSIFYQDGSVYDQSSYENWATGQPSGNEHYLQIFTDNVQPEYTPGEWNDRSGGYESGYIVEYGGMTGDPALTMTTTTTLNIDLVTPKSPGGIVDNLALWLDAEKGFTYTSATDAEWIDQSHNRLALNVNLIQNPDPGTVAPTLAENSNNFNSTLAFDGANTGLASAVDAADFGFSEVTVFSVQKVASGAHSHCVWHYDDKGVNNLAVFIDGRTTDHPDRFNITVNKNSLGDLTNPVLNDDTPHLLGFASNASSAEVYVDTGYVQTSEGQSPLPGSGAMMIGLDADEAEAQDGDNHLKGNVGEVIMFNKKLSTLDQQKVGSYLALKYGISLTGNYIASDGTTSMWADDSDGYDQNIFGIGRDDASGLNQKVSKSVSAGTVLTVALDADFTSANNDTERTTEHVNDLQFLTIANNGEAVTPQFSEVDEASGFNVRLAREWKVDATGNFTQNISLKFEGSDDEWTLYKDNDGDFSSGATALGTLNANGEITNISLADGDYLTLGKRLDAPGGVFNNLRVWFNANSGTANGGSETTNGSITSWEGQIVQSANIAKVGNVTGDPAVVSNSANFNSVVSFDGDDAIRTTSRVPYTTYFNSTDNNTTFLVKKSTAGNVEAGYAYANGTTTERGGYFERADGYQRSDYGENITILAGRTTTINKYIIARQDVQPGDFSLYLDGVLERQTNTFNTLSGGTAGYLGFGANPHDFTAKSTVDIAEYIIYAADLSATEIKEVESYLALKYGISKADDYLASDGSTIWSTSDNTGYTTGIFGIGQDDGSGLNQKISRSVNNNNSPVLSTTANFSLSNADASRTALGDGNFMMMGHNNGAENSFNSSFNGGTNNRTDRVWKVDETGTVGDVYFAIPYAAVTFPSGGTPSVIISGDENFDDQDQVIPLTYDRNMGGYYAKIDPADGDYISLAISEISVTLPTFYRTESTGDATTGITSYPSYTDFINNTNATYTAFNQHWNYDDSFFADGIYFYRTNNAKTTVTRYPSLADLGENTKGIVYDFTSGGNPQDWNDDDEFFASGDQFFRTASSNSISKTTGLTAYNSFADLVSNTNGTYTPFNHDYNYEDQFFHDGEYFLRTNTSTTNQEQFGVARYQSLDDLSNHTPYDTKGFGPWSTNDDIFAVGITASFTISEDTLAFDENGGKGEFYVVLDAQPATNVVLDITSDDTNEATVNKAALTFTSANWNTPQTITVTGVNDNTVKVDTAKITISVNESSDATFAALANQSVEIILEDDDVAGFTLSESTLTIDEDAGTDSFTVVLNTQPISDVVFDVLSDADNEAIVSVSLLNFTSANWNTPQTVTVTGVNDEIDREDNATITISVNAASSDDTYDAEEDQTVAVALTDDDEVPTVSTTAASSVISTSVVLGGNITDSGTSEVTETGVVYSSINTSPEIGGDNVTKDVNGAETGEFSETIGSLAPNTTYYYQAYAVSNAGISYGGVQSFTTKQAQVITFNELADKTYGDIDFDPAATASSNLTITYSSSDAAVATIVDGKIHIVGAGSCIIYADQEGNEVYDAAPQASQTLTVNKKSITVTADADQTKVYGDSDPTFTYSTSVELESGDSFTGSLSRVAGEDVGSYAITIGSLSASTNYDLSFVGNNFTITKKAITVTAESGQTKVYGQVDPTLTYTTSPALESGDSFSGSLSRVAGEDVGSYAITIGSLSASTNYDLSFVGNNFTITKKAITVTAESGQTKVYGQVDPTLTYTTSPALESGDSFSGSLSRVAGEDAGSYAITIGSLSAGSNYDLSFVDDNFTITKKAITVTAESGQTKVYGQVDPTLTYTTSPALESGDSFSGSLSRVAGEDVGGYAITIGSLSAGSNYDLSFEDDNFTITKKAITVTAESGQTKVYGQVDPTLTYTTSPALESGDSFSGSLSRVAGEDVGGYAITIGSLSAGSNYDLSFVDDNFTITKKAITVTAESGQTKVYGQVDPTLTYTTSPALESGDSFSGSLSRVAGEDVGSYAITIGSLSAGTNYDLSFVDDNFTITKKAITVTAESGQTKVYGQVDPTLTYTTSPALESGDSFSGSLSRVAGEDAGSYAITIGSLSAGSNYDLSFVDDNFTITKKAITVTAESGQTKVYGQVDPTLTYTTSPALESGDSFGGSLSRVAGEDVGGYAITIGSLSAGTNYAISFESDDFVITKAILTVTANDKSKVYGTANPELTFNYSGFVNGDTESVLATVPVVTTTATTESPAGNYKIKVSGGDDENYTFSYTDAILTVERATLTVSVSADNKVYDGTTTASVLLSDNRVSGDLLTVNTTSAEFEDKNVGEEKTVTVSGIILSGDDANNYELASATASATADITRKNLTVSNAVAQNKVYDGTTDAVISGAVLKGVVLNDDVQLEDGAIGTFDRATSGSDIEVTTLMTLNGEDAPNYLLVQPTGLVADILEKALTINGTFTVTDKKYDGTTDATIVTNKLELSGIQGEDEVALSNVVVAFETASAGNGLPLKIISADLTGDDADQYSLSFENSPTTTASILSKEVTLAGAGGISKIYDGNTLLPSGMVAYGALNGVLSEDETQVELTGNPLYDLAEAGDRVIVQGDLKLTGPKADNYTLVWTDGEGIIGEATLTVVANNDAKFVTQDDDSNYAGVSISGYVNGESNSVIDQSGLTITRSNVTENSAGEYTDVLEASGLMADNYVFTYLSGDYSIIPAHELLVEINDSNIIYSNVPGYTIDNAKYLDSEGNTIKDLTENITALGNNQFRVDDGVGNAVNFTISEINPEYNSLNTRLAVGSYQLKATDVTGSSTNFNNNIHVTGALTVNTKEVEVQLISGSEQKAFDGDANMDNLDLFTSGLVTGDDVELSGSGSFNQSEAGSDISYSVEVALQGVDKDNYHLKTDVPITGNDGRIIQIELTVIDAKASNKVYDGTTSATVSGATLNGAIAGDDVTLANKNTGVFVTDAVGNDIEVMTSMTLAGEDKDNYVLIQPTGLTANITPKELTVTNATAENKVYDGSTDVTVVGATLSGVIADDEVLLENAESGTFKQDIVGTEIEVTTAMTISGADAPNYVLNQPFGITADITTRELTVKDAVAENKIYDGTVSAVISGAVLDGNVAGDDVSLTNDIAGIFAQSSVGDNIQVVTQMALEGDDKDNYTLKQPSYLTANITAAELTLSGSFVAENKEYDGTAIATMIENNIQFDGLAPGDIISLDSIILAFETSNAGIGLEVDIIGAKIAGSDASKYMFSLDGSPVTTANINKKELIIIADDKAKDYDGLGYSPFTVSYNGFIDGEDETVLSGTLSFTGTATTAQDAGTGYVVTPGGLSSENYEITYVDGYLDIHRTDQTITFDPIPQQILSNSSFELSAVASSGLTIEYSSSDESVATVSGKMVTFVNSGTCTIYANQTGNVNYNAAEQVSQTLTIISYVSGDSNHDGQITPPEIAGDSNEDGQINDGEIAGDTNGDGTITAPEVAGDTDGNGQIDEGEVTGDTNGDGIITAPEIAGDTDGNGQIDDGEIAGDTNGDGTITAPEIAGDTDGNGQIDDSEVAGDTNGDGTITAPEVAGDTDGNGQIDDDEVAGDTDGNGQIEEGEVTGDTNGDGTITAPEVAGDADGNGQIDDGEIAGDSNHDGQITPPEIAGDSNEDGQINDGEIAGDTNGDGTITAPEVAGDTNGDGIITAPEIAGDTDGNGEINGDEVAGDTNGDGTITSPEVAGDTDGNGQIDDDEVAGDTDGNGQIEEGEVTGDTNGDGTITAPEVAGDADGNGQIDDGEIAGDSNHDGQITPPEIAGDSNEDGQINDGEIAGDTNGDGTITEPEVAGDTNGDGIITAPEIAGDTDGNGEINDDEVAGDTNGDGTITSPEVAGDTDGNGQIDEGEVTGDTNGDGIITAPEIAGDTDGNGEINDDEVAGDTNGDGSITSPEVAGDTDGNGEINDDEVAGDTDGNGQIDEGEVTGDTNGDGIITAPEIAGDTDGNGEINDDEVAGDTNGDGTITSPEVAGDTDGNGQIDDGEIAGDTDGNGQIDEGEVTGDTNGDGTITAPEVAGDADGNGQIDDGEIAGDSNHDGQITPPEIAGDSNEDGQINDGEIAGDTNGDGTITEPEVAGDTNGDGIITAPEIAGDTDGNGEINDDEVAGDTDGNGQIEEGEVTGDTNGDGTITEPEVAGDTNGDGIITAPEVAGDTDGNGEINDDEVAGDTDGNGQIDEGEVTGDTNGDGTITEPEVAGDTNGDGIITAPEIAGDTDGNGEINDDEVAGDTNGDGSITSPEVAGDTDGNGQIDNGEIAGDTDGNGEINDDEVAGDTNGDGSITSPEVAGDTDGNGQIDNGEIAGDIDGNGEINDDEVAGDTDGDGTIIFPEIIGDTDGNGQIDDGEVAGDINGDGKIGEGEVAVWSVADISVLIINGEAIENPDEDVYYLLDCDYNLDYAAVSFELDSFATSEHLASFEMSIPNPGIYQEDIMVVSADGSQNRTYHVVIEKRFNFDDIIIQKYDNVLLVNNNPGTNGGYRFIAFNWYKNGVSVGTGQYYSAGDDASDQLDLDAKYSVEMETEDGDILQTCEFGVTYSDVFSLKVSPNPVKSGSIVNVVTTYSPNMLEDMNIRVRDIYGGIVMQRRVRSNSSQITLPPSLAPGTYIVTTEAEGVELSTKIIVQ